MSCVTPEGKNLSEGMSRQFGHVVISPFLCSVINWVIVPFISSPAASILLIATSSPAPASLMIAVDHAPPTEPTPIDPDPFSLGAADEAAFSQLVGRVFRQQHGRWVILRVSAMPCTNFS